MNGVHALRRKGMEDRLSLSILRGRSEKTAVRKPGGELLLEPTHATTLILDLAAF